MNEREILEDSIKQHQVAIDEAKRKLADISKPKLRHGDYGYDLSWGCQPKERLFLKKRNDDEVFACNKIGQTDGHTIYDSCKPVVLGNIFDDLKRNLSWLS